MDKTTEKSWRVRLAALGIFALGLLAGALLITLYNAGGHLGSDGRRDGPPIWALSSVTERLDLSSEQSAQVEKILDDAKQQLLEMRRQSEPRIKEIRAQTEEQLRQVLTDEQWQRFQELKREVSDRHRGGRRGHGREADR